MAMTTAVKITDPSVSPFHQQRETVFNSMKKQATALLKEHRQGAANFKDFETKVSANDKLYQEATESFIPTEGIVAELKECIRGYQGYKELLGRVSILEENILATIQLLQPKARSIQEEKELEANAPNLYAQLKASESVCLNYLTNLQTPLKKTLNLKDKLLEQINNPKVSTSLQRFIGIVDNQGKPLPAIARTFTQPAVLTFHMQRENTYEGTKGEITSTLPSLRTAVKETESFTHEVRAQGSAYQNAIEPLTQQDVLQKAQQYCAKFHGFLATHEKVLCLEEQISKAIQFLTPAPRSPAADQSLKETNRPLYDETTVSEDACKGYAAQLKKSLGTIKELNAQLVTAAQDATTKWALVRICEILKNNCQPLPLTSRSVNFFSSYVCNQVIPKPEELKLPESKKEAPIETEL